MLDPLAGLPEASCDSERWAGMLSQNMDSPYSTYKTMQLRTGASVWEARTCLS